MNTKINNEIITEMNTEPRSNTIEQEEEYEVDVYPRREVVFVRGRGTTLFDEEGNAYLDCATNVGVSSLGHGRKEIAEAIYEQYLRLANCYSMFYNDVRAKLARRLAEITPDGLNKVFFTNSGAEAVEAAIKFARVSTGRTNIIAAMRGFHGRTFGALSATWEKKYREPFQPLTPGFSFVPFNNIEKLREVITETADDTAAVLLEVVQGEGGVRLGDQEYFKEVRKLTEEKGILLIIDEVQTGFSRTGTMFACEQYVTPDILCLAKAIAGGIPMGAVLCDGNKINVPKRSHGSTFGGNPLACAAALASIDIIERDKLVDSSAEMGSYLLERLREIQSDKIREVRGRGLMIGIELKEKAGPYVKALMDKGIVVLLAGNFVIRLLPPLIISKEESDIIVEAIRSVLSGD